MTFEENIKRVRETLKKLCEKNRPLHEDDVVYLSEFMERLSEEREINLQRIQNLTNEIEDCKKWLQSMSRDNAKKDHQIKMLQDEIAGMVALRKNEEKSS